MTSPGNAESHATFELWAGPFAGRTLEVVSFTGRESISKLFSFDVRVIVDLGVDLLEGLLVGMPATFAMQAGPSSHRIVQGIVASITRVSDASRRSHHTFSIRVVPKLWQLRKRIRSRIFQDLTVPEIIALVLDGGGIAHTEKLARGYAKRAYCVQYQESDFAFVARLAAEEGMFWYFQQPSGLLEDLAGAWASAIAGAAADVGSMVGGAVGSAISGAAAVLGVSETVVFGDSPQSYLAVGATSALGAEVDVSVGLGGVTASASVGLGGGDSMHLKLAHGTADSDSTGEDVFQFALTQSLRSNAVEVRDYDFQRPLLDLRSNVRVEPNDISFSVNPSRNLADAARSAVTSFASAAVSAVAGALTSPDFEVYDHKGEYDEPEVNPVRARVLLEQQRTRVRAAEGESGCRLLAPGHRFWLDTEEVPMLALEYVVTSLRHEGHVAEHGSTAGRRERTYQNIFECIPATVPARPKRPKRRIQNVMESATVVGPAGADDIYTDESGRVKVQFHWDREGQRNERSSCWIRVIQAWAGASFGMQFVPRIGMEVMVSFLSGDEDCPVITGCVYNATHPPPFLLPSDKTRSGLRTQSSPSGGGSNELSFEDAKGKEQIYMPAQRDLDEVVDRHHTFQIGKDETINIGGVQSLTVSGDRNETVKGHTARTTLKDESVKVDGNRVDVVNGNADLRVNGELTTRVGRERREIRGRGDLVLNDDYTVRVNGSYTTIVGKNDAKRSYVLRVEGAGQLSSSGVIEIDAEKGLTLKCGKSFIKISSDKIELVAPSVSAKGEGGGIVVADDDIKLNAKGDAIFKTKTFLMKTDGASMSLKKDVQIDGSQILLNSPDKAKDPVVDKSPPPTAIQMKDQSGKPLAYQRFVVKLGDGSEQNGVLDSEGKTEMDLSGSASVTFPDLAKAK